MKKYLVGGAVRDELQGKQPNDLDYVVVGSSIEEMLSKGYKQVGKEFPVFLDNDGNEIALARKDYKIGDKHTDFKFNFSSDITLEEDLKRRDVTINSMAKDLETGMIIDPFKGQESLKNGLLEITDKEHFGDDALRILRVARFSAQLDFGITLETLEIMTDMVNKGMLNHLTPERVWKETEKALSYGYNSPKYFEVLNMCGALKVLFPEIYQLIKTPERVEFHPSGTTYKHTMIALDRVRYASSLVKFAVLNHDDGKGTTPTDILPKHIGHENRGGELIDSLCDRIKVPNEYRDFAKLFCKYHMRFYRLLNMKLFKQYQFVKAISGNFRNLNLLMDMLECFRADFFGENDDRMNHENEDYKTIVNIILTIFNIMKDVRLENLSQKVQEKLSHLKGEKFGECYENAMVNYLYQQMKKEK